MVDWNGEVERCRAGGDEAAPRCTAAGSIRRHLLRVVVSLRKPWICVWGFWGQGIGLLTADSVEKVPPRFLPTKERGRR